MKRNLLFGPILLIIAIVLTVSCATPAPLGPTEPVVKDAVEARQAAITYIQGKAAADAPNLGTKWQESDETPPGLVGAANKYYTSDEWVVSVSYPIVLPDLTVYRVVIVSEKFGWHWKGEVKADGTVTEISAFQQMTEEASKEVAKDFVINSPTFVFDGIEGSFQLTETLTLRCPYCWQFIFEFDSAQAGYGDRTGQMLAQVITHHIAVITVDNLEVTRAVMDEQWDMLQQKMIEEALPPPPPTRVPAAPNDSIVTAKVLDVINVGGDIPWEIVMEIQSSEDVPGLNNATKSRIGETITVITSEDVSGVEKGQVITAHVQLRGDERSRFYEASEIK
ncbi:hypothetical protein ACFLWR_07315 [Chloroflexota bacterium]